MIDPIFWKSALLGVIQGLTEFLPVSSTGHLILAGNFMQLDAAEETFATMFDVVVQLSSILAVVIYFRKQLLPAAIFYDGEVRKKTFQIWFKTVIGVIPALVIGFCIKDYVECWHKNPWIVVAALFVGGIVLIGIDSLLKKGDKISEIEKFSWKKALVVGFFQCIAMIPGVSRSAATIIGGLALGASRPLAAEYSFFLAIPTMAAASGYSLLKHGGMLTLRQWIAMAIGFTVSFLVSWGVIAWLMDFIRKRSFQIFGWYRVILAVVIALVLLQKIR